MQACNIKIVLLHKDTLFHCLNHMKLGKHYDNYFNN